MNSKSNTLFNKHSYNIEKHDNHTCIQVLTEKLDTNVAPDLKSEVVLISGKGERNIIIDLSNVKYCDSNGLSAILVANRLCKNANGTFVLSGLNDVVYRFITISQTETVLNIAYSKGAAEEIIKVEEENKKIR